jgi:hypothetical protein
MVGNLVLLREVKRRMLALRSCAATNAPTGRRRGMQAVRGPFSGWRPAMKRRTTLLAATVTLIALAGCEIIDHGGDLPPDRAAADARYHDPFDGISSPTLDQEIRRDMRR